MTNGYHADGTGTLDKRQAEENAMDEAEMESASNESLDSSNEEGRKVANRLVDGDKRKKTVADK